MANKKSTKTQKAASSESKVAPKLFESGVSSAMADAFTQTLIEHDLMPPIPEFDRAPEPSFLATPQPLVEPLFDTLIGETPSLFQGTPWQFNGPAGTDVQGVLNFSNTGVNAEFSLGNDRTEFVQVQPNQVTLQSTGSDGVKIDYFSAANAPGSLFVETPKAGSQQFQWSDSGQMILQGTTANGAASSPISTDTAPTQVIGETQVWVSPDGSTISKTETDAGDWTAQIATPQGLQIDIQQNEQSFYTQAMVPNGSVSLEYDSGSSAQSTFVNPETGTLVHAFHSESQRSDGFATARGWGESVQTPEGHSLTRYQDDAGFVHNYESSLGQITVTGNRSGYQANYQFSDNSQYQESFRNNGSFGTHWVRPAGDQFALTADSNVISEHFESPNGYSENITYGASQNVSLEFEDTSGTMIANQWTPEDGLSISVADVNGAQVSVNASVASTQFLTSDSEGTMFKFDQALGQTPEIAYHSADSSAQYRIEFQPDGAPLFLSASAIGEFQPIKANQVPFTLSQDPDLSQTPVLQNAYDAAAPSELVTHQIQLAESDRLQSVAQPGRFQATSFSNEAVHFQHYADFDQNSKYENWQNGVVRGGSYFVEGSYSGQYFHTADGPTFLKEVSPDGNETTVYNSPESGFSHVITDTSGAQYTHTIDANDIHSYIQYTQLGLRSLQVQPDGGIHFSGPVGAEGVCVQHHIQPDLQSIFSVQGNDTGTIQNWIDGVDGCSYGDFQTSTGLRLHIQNSATGFFGKLEAPSGYQSSWLTQPNGGLLYSAASEDGYVSHIQHNSNGESAWTCYYNGTLYAKQNWQSGEPIPASQLQSGERLAYFTGTNGREGFAIETEFGAIRFQPTEGGDIRIDASFGTFFHSVQWNSAEQGITAQSLQLGSVQISHDYGINDTYQADYAIGDTTIQMHSNAHELICRGYDQLVKTDFPAPAPQGVKEFPNGLAETSGFKEILAEVTPPLGQHWA